jgi:dTDP-4-amino-4,6-dideoxygalactose transaminase
MTDAVTAFEARFASMIGADYAIAVNSGTSALHTALVAIGVADHEVIMPALCPGLVAFPIIMAGGIPVFVDVDADTQLITAATVQPAITAKTAAIIAVALHGLPCNIAELKRFNLPIVEDCAQALFARYKDGFAGTFGSIGCYSFERSKHMTTGSEGGAIVTNDPQLAKSMRVFSGLGYGHLGAAGGGTRIPSCSPDYARFGAVGLNYRLSEAQATIGLEKLKTVMDAVTLRQLIGSLWEETLKTPLQKHSYSADNAFYAAAYPYTGDWHLLHARFLEAGGDGFYAAPRNPYREPALSYLSADCPMAQYLQANLVLLKTHYSWDEAQRQAQILKSVMER